VANQGDGWSFTVDFLKRHLEDRLVTSWNPEEGETAQRREQEEAEDAFFMSHVRTLGVRTGELHSALAAPTQDEAFRPQPASSEEVAGWARHVLTELERTLELLEERRGEPHPDVENLLAARDGLAENAIAICDHGFEAVKTRYHGDFHLGRVLVANNDFQIIDFEGDPAMPPGERRAKHSPLRDVATMLRSFDRAARSAIATFYAEWPDRVGDMESWTRRLERRVRETFLEGYAEGERDSISHLEDKGQASKLIELFSLERVLYEVRRALDHSPSREGIPIREVLDHTESPAVEHDT
jgi:maltose alpha-D-glucosyltransferase/alpha-amylase